MAATPETGFLVIADLTGYTAYLAGSELEHAPAMDLDAVDDGTQVRLRWAFAGEPPVDAGAVERARAEKQAAFDRLASTVGGSAGAVPVA